MAEVFNDKLLYQQWITKDLPKIAKALKDRREILANTLSHDMRSTVKEGVGLFTVLPIVPNGIIYLREKYSIYVVPNGHNQMRINIGGVSVEQMCRAAPAIKEALDLYHL